MIAQMLAKPTSAAIKIERASAKSLRGGSQQSCLGSPWYGHPA
jgi:hypothetical protein